MANARDIKVRGRLQLRKRSIGRPVPGMAIRHNEAREFFKGWAAHLAYQHFCSGENTLPADITPYELQRYKSMITFLDLCKLNDIQLPDWNVDNPPPQHLVALIANMTLEYVAADRKHDDGRVVNP